jgi:hypothetical protein
MDIYQVEDLFKKIYKNKKVEISFDPLCVKTIEIGFLNGVPNEVHHLEFDRVKVTVDSAEDNYVDIMPHRDVMSFDDIDKRFFIKFTKPRIS